MSCNTGLYFGAGLNLAFAPVSLLAMFFQASETLGPNPLMSLVVVLWRPSWCGKHNSICASGQ